MIRAKTPTSSFDLQRWEGSKIVTVGSVELPDFRKPPTVLIIGNEVWLWDEFMSYRSAESVWVIGADEVKPPAQQEAIPSAA